MARRFAGLVFLSALLISQFIEPPRAAALDVRCRVKTLKSPTRWRLEGSFQYQVLVKGENDVQVESILLVFNRLGEVEMELPVSDGDVFDVQIRKTIAVEPSKSTGTAVSAPGVLFRATAREDGESSVAYCSPFAAVWMDQPADSLPAGDPVRVVAGFDKLVSSSIEILVDGVKIYSSAAGSAEVTPYSATVDIGGVAVKIEDLSIDQDTGIISFALSNLAESQHHVTVKGDPVYGVRSKTRRGNEKQLRGILENDCTLTVQRARTPTAHLRLVFVQRNLRSDSHINEVRDIARRASEHGYTGIVLSGSFDYINIKPQEYFYRLASVKKICSDYGLELIPLVMSIGYGSILQENPDLAAAVPVVGLPMIVENGVGVVARDPSIGFDDGGFERCDLGEGPTEYRFDVPGTVSVVDTQISKEGEKSIRFQNFEAADGGRARLIKTVRVEPFRCYEFQCWVKTEELKSKGGFCIQALSKDGRVLMFWYPEITETMDWTEVRTGFNSLAYEEVRLYVGVWGGRSGRLWIDKMSLNEVGLLNVLRRPGTPVTVRGENSGMVYEEGKDYELTPEKRLSFKFDHPEPVLRAIDGGRMDGTEPLRVDYYQALALKRGSGQVGVCVSEPKTCDIWRDVVKTVDEHLGSNYYFISGDEVRHGGWCAACRNRGLSGGELLGEWITRQVNLIHSVNPNAKVIIWSDMLDPNHNAKNNFFLFNGDISGSWDYVPKELIIACWKFSIRDKSLSHFEKNGFQTIGCGYYDSGSLENAKGWIESLNATERACGIMYTTWKNEYGYLESYGDLWRERE